MNTSLVVRKPVLAVAIAGLVGGAAWSPASLACGQDDYIATVCAMAAVNLNDWGNQFLLANGRFLQISTYSPLYALIGNTYGGQGATTFAIPDLRGRVIVGAGQRPGQPIYRVGQTGGHASIVLAASQIPAHTHTISIPTHGSGMTATTTLSGLSATADLGGVNVSGPASGLRINGSPSTTTNSPNGAYPGTTGVTSKIYSTNAPSSQMNAGAISGNLSLTIASGTTAPVSISGNASTTLGGTLNGLTGSTGNSAAVDVMPPYVAMKYYIAATGLFPTND